MEYQRTDSDMKVEQFCGKRQGEFRLLQQAVVLIDRQGFRYPISVGIEKGKNRHIIKRKGQTHISAD